MASKSVYFSSQPTTNPKTINPTINPPQNQLPIKLPNRPHPTHPTVIYVAAPGMCFAPAEPTTTTNEPNTTDLKTTQKKRGRPPKLADNFRSFNEKRNFSSSSKRIIMNVFNNTDKLYPKATIRQRIWKTAALTGVDEVIIQKIRHENHTQEKLNERIKRVQYPQEKSSGFELCYIRNKIHEIYLRNEFPTVKKVLNEIRKENFRPINAKVLNRWLSEIGFKCKRLKMAQKDVLVECDDVIARRREYLRLVINYRNSGKNIYYIHEPCFSDGVRKQGIVTIGSSKGFVKDCVFVYKNDVIDEKVVNLFNKWMEKIFTRIDPNSVVVIDKVLCANMVADKLPTPSCSKKCIQDWLERKKISFPQDALKAELLVIVNSVMGEYQLNFVEKRAVELGFCVLVLPSNYCQLNLLEMVWSQIETDSIFPTVNLTLKELELRIEEVTSGISPDTWTSYTKLVIEEEEKLWNNDIYIEQIIDQLLLNDKKGDCSMTESSSDEDNGFNTFPFPPQDCAIVDIS